MEGQLVANTLAEKLQADYRWRDKDDSQMQRITKAATGLTINKKYKLMVFYGPSNGIPRSTAKCKNFGRSLLFTLFASLSGSSQLPTWTSHSMQ